jgi:hypothetical protein
MGRQRLACFCCLAALLSWSCCSGAAAQPAAGSSSSQQDSRQPGKASKVSKIVATAGETELVNGFGDVRPDGAFLTCGGAPTQQPKQTGAHADATAAAAAASGALLLLCAGACRADVRALCKDVSPGGDRLLHCLTRRIKQAQQGNIAGARVCAEGGCAWRCPAVLQPHAVVLSCSRTWW